MAGHLIFPAHVFTNKRTMPVNKTEKLGIFQVVILILSVYVLVALAVATFLPVDEEIRRLLDIIDNLICFIFLLDFFIRFYRAESKLKFLKWGWIDFISSIPSLDYFRAGRLLRIIRILRILRAFRSIRLIASHIFRNRIKGTFGAAALLAFLMVIFSSLAILQVEDAPNSNITTAEDAVWWSFVTVTTVGYGDRYPVTTEGRIIGASLMIVGVGLFGVFTGFIASWIVGVKDDKER